MSWLFGDQASSRKGARKAGKSRSGSAGRSSRAAPKSSSKLKGSKSAGKTARKTSSKKSAASGVSRGRKAVSSSRSYTQKTKKRSSSRGQARRRPSSSSGSLLLAFFGLAKRPQKKKRRAKAARRFGVFSVAYWGSVTAIWACLAFGALLFYYSVTLPDPLLAGLKSQGHAIRVLAKDGSLIAERGLSQHYVRLEKLPKVVSHAVLAIEDRRFYYHFGFDPIGFVRAMAANVRAGRFVQGGSTITQQLAKNLFLNSERTLSRKFREMGLALWLETRFEKDQILELYLNRVYFGAKAYGIDQAARRYFGKHASELDLSEAALLAGLLKAPSRLNPKRHYKRAKQRADVVLAAMARSGFITPLSAKTAQLSPAQLRQRHLPLNSNYIADWIAELVPEFVTDFSSDIVVETTIDPLLQRRANRAVVRHLQRTGKSRRVSQAAMVMLAPDGAVRALVGGKNYQKSQYNRAVHSQRQTGSVFKPFVYLAALEAGFERSSLVYDRPTRFRNWQPRNHQNKYRGQIALETALAHSSNVVAVKLLGTVGVAKTIETARRLGVQGDLKKDLSLALGTSEQSLLNMTAAYAPFANGGRGVMPFVIAKVRTMDGTVLYQRRDVALPQVVHARHVNEMNHMLRSVVQRGSGRGARIVGPDGRHDFAGKTGTTQKFRDGWFVGYSAYYITGVWVGNDDGQAMRHVTGGGLPAVIWSEAMSDAHFGLRPKVMIANSQDPITRNGWREVGLTRRIKRTFFEQALAP